MPKPQQPELRRSERVPDLAPEATQAVREAEASIDVSEPVGDVPPEQRSDDGDDSPEDKPDLDAFAERFGSVDQGVRHEPRAEERGARAVPSKRSNGPRPAVVAAVIALVLLVLWRRRS